MPNLPALQEIDFDLLKAYINTGRRDILTPQLAQQVDLCHEAYGILSRHPSRAHAVKRLQSLHPELSYSTCARYVDFTRQTWGDYLGYTRQFLESFFINTLLEEISNTETDPPTRARLLATLQKHLERMPDQTLDPTLLEANTINIQVNIAGQPLTINEQTLQRLPAQAREALLAAITQPADITEAEAAEMIG